MDTIRLEVKGVVAFNCLTYIPMCHFNPGRSFPKKPPKEADGKLNGPLLAGIHDVWGKDLFADVGDVVGIVDSPPPPPGE